MMQFWPAFQQLQSSGTPFCCVTLVDGVGSVPSDSGSKMLVTHEGLVAGTIGGGKIEARALAQCQELLKNSGTKTQFAQWNLQTDLGMTCGGLVRLFFETFNVSRWPIVIFGAGHVAQSLVRTLLPLDCQLTCFDTRAEWVEQLPDAGNLRRAWTTDMASEVEHLAPHSFVLVMTMGHATDLPILRAVLPRAFPYVGVIGSKSKARTLRRTLLQEGFAPEDCERFFCPVGLPIGTNHLHEMAISIAAQLLQERDRLGCRSDKSIPEKTINTNTNQIS